MAFMWLSGTRRSMQRLGFCKAVLIFSDRARTSAGMADVMRIELMENYHPIPFDTKFCDWMKTRPNGGKVIRNDDGTISVQIQNIYTFRHSSQSGWLSRLGFNEYVEYLPKKLQLIDSICDPTNMGEVLLKALMDDREKKSFEMVSDKINPLSLNIQQQIYFLYSILTVEGDFFIPFVSSLLSNFGEDSFSYLDVGKILPRAIEIVASNFSGAIYTSEDRNQWDSLIRLKEKVEKWNEDEIEHEGSGSRREQINVPRLEWMLDLGLVKKVKSDKSASKLTYTFTKLGKTFTREISQFYEQTLKDSYPEESLRQVLDNSFYSIINLSYFDGKAKPFSGNDVLSFLQDGYELLKDVYGYCLCRPLLLLSNILALNKSNSLFLEYNRAMELIETAYQRNPSQFHYTIDRFSTDYQIKLE